MVTTAPLIPAYAMDATLTQKEGADLAGLHLLCLSKRQALRPRLPV